jgi:hypothetical protein
MGLNSNIKIWRQKVKRFKLWPILITSLLLIALSLTVVPVYAQNHGEVQPTSEKIRPDPYPLDNTLNPKSPNYDPSNRYGGEGTRFGPPGERSEEIPLASELDSRGDRYTYHHWYGAEIKDVSGIVGARAKQEVHTNLTLNDSSDYLYAPTLIAPNECALESVTYYDKKLFGMDREWRVWDHTTEQFEYATDINASFCDKYVRNGFYYTKVVEILSTWYACLWNYNSNYWDAKYNQDDDGDRSDGWNIWEEYDLDNDWPTLPEIQSYDLEVYDGSYWIDVDSSTYGAVNSDLPGGFPYLYGFNHYYDDWYVGPNDE